MPTVRYTMPQQGFRPKTNPLGALNAYGRRSRLRGLGDAASDALAAEYGAGGSAPTDIYGTIQAGSMGIFQAAWPWLATVAFLLWVKKK